jgi:hypothetical protein
MTAAKALMGAASGLADPCGYVKDQLLAQNQNQCPASILLPSRPFAPSSAPK